MRLLRLDQLAVPPQARGPLAADHRRASCSAWRCSWRCTRRTRRCSSRSSARSIASPARRSCRSRPAKAGFDEEVLERVQAVPEVQVAVPVIEAAAGTDWPGQGNLLILGVDMTGDRSLRDVRSRERRRGDRRRSAGVSGAARFDHRHAASLPPERLRVGGTLTALDDGGRQGVHRPRHHALGRHDQRVRRQSRGDGHLRGAAGLRPRPAFDRIDVELKEGVAVEAGQARDSASARRGLRRGAAGRARPAVRVDAGGLRDLDEHLERVRAVHRDVHHLQLVRDRGDAAALGDRHPARARRDARQIRKLFLDRERGRRRSSARSPASRSAS